MRSAAFAIGGCPRRRDHGVMVGVDLVRARPRGCGQPGRPAGPAATTERPAKHGTRATDLGGNRSARRRLRTQPRTLRTRRRHWPRPDRGPPGADTRPPTRRLQLGDVDRPQDPRAASQLGVHLNRRRDRRRTAFPEHRRSGAPRRPGARPVPRTRRRRSRRRLAVGDDIRGRGPRPAEILHLHQLGEDRPRRRRSGGAQATRPPRARPRRRGRDLGAARGVQRGAGRPLFQAIDSVEAREKAARHIYLYFNRTDADPDKAAHYQAIWLASVRGER